MDYCLQSAPAKERWEHKFGPLAEHMIAKRIMFHEKKYIPMLIKGGISQVRNSMRLLGERPPAYQQLGALVGCASSEQLWPQLWLWGSCSWQSWVLQLYHCWTWVGIALLGALGSQQCRRVQKGDGWILWGSFRLDIRNVYSHKEQWCTDTAAQGGVGVIIPGDVQEHQVEMWHFRTCYHGNGSTVGLNDRSGHFQPQ